MSVDHEALSALEQFARSAGHTAVPLGYVTEGGERLGRWVSLQRRRADRLTPAAREALEEVPYWAWSAGESSRRAAAVFSEAVAQLTSYGAERGSCDPLPGEVFLPAGVDLSRWVTVYRQCHSQGCLPAEQVAGLESITQWRWNNPHSAWGSGVAAVHRFTAIHTHSAIPKDYRDPQLKLQTLDSWVSKTRAAYRGGMLTASQVNEMESIPHWRWDANDAAWEAGWQALNSYCERVGDARPAQSLVTEDGFQLGRWVARQRAAFLSGRLSEDHAARLSSLPGWFWRRGEATTAIVGEDVGARVDGRSAREWITLIARYIERTGMTEVGPQTFVLDSTGDRAEIGRWLHSTADRGRKLSPSDRVALRNTGARF